MFHFTKILRSEMFMAFVALLLSIMSGTKQLLLMSLTPQKYARRLVCFY